MGAGLWEHRSAPGEDVGASCKDTPGEGLCAPMGSGCWKGLRVCAHPRCHGHAICRHIDLCMVGNWPFGHPRPAQGPGPAGFVVVGMGPEWLFPVFPFPPGWTIPVRNIFRQLQQSKRSKTLQSSNQTAEGRTEKLKLAELPQAEGHLGLCLVSLLTFISFIYNLWLIDFFFNILFFFF